MRRWYVVHTHAGAERKALSHLQRQQFTAYLPQYLKQRRHARRVDRVATPLFPRYLFVAMDLERSRWRAVQSTRGVKNVVCGGERPVALPSGFVEHIRNCEDHRGFVLLSAMTPLREGQPVRIMHGAFADLVGLLESSRDNERVVVLLELLGREVRLRFPRAAISVAA